MKSRFLKRMWMSRVDREDGAGTRNGTGFFLRVFDGNVILLDAGYNFMDQSTVNLHVMHERLRKWISRGTLLNTPRMDPNSFRSSGAAPSSGKYSLIINVHRNRRPSFTPPLNYLCHTFRSRTGLHFKIVKKDTYFYSELGVADVSSWLVPYNTKVILLHKTRSLSGNEIGLTLN